MQRTDLVTSMGGNITYVKYTLGFGDLTAAATTQTVILLTNPAGSTLPFIIPQGGVVMGVKVHATTSFTGGGVTAMTMSVGVTGTVTALTSAFDIFQATGNTVVQETPVFKSTTIAPISIVAAFTSTTANLNLLTAGSVDVYICLLNVSTPSA